MKKQFYIIPVFVILVVISLNVFADSKDIQMIQTTDFRPDGRTINTDVATFTDGYVYFNVQVPEKYDEIIIEPTFKSNRDFKIGPRNAVEYSYGLRQAYTVDQWDDVVLRFSQNETVATDKNQVNFLIEVDSFDGESEVVFKDIKVTVLKRGIFG